MILPAPARSQIIADWKFDLATQSPLAIACFYDDYHRLEEMLREGGGDPDEVDGGGYSLLMLSCELGFPDVVRVLLQGGADPNVERNRPHYRFTALGMMCELGEPVYQKHVACADLLFEYGGAKVIDYQKKKNGQTPLMIAAAEDNLEFVAWLLDRGAHVDLRDVDGRTALDYSFERFACSGKTKEGEAIRKLLLQAGCWSYL